MVYRKRRTSRRRRSSRKKFYRKKRRVMKIPRSVRNGNVIHVKLRHADVQLLVNQLVTETSFYYRPQLNLCTNYSQYCNLWDFYRLNFAVVKFFPIRTTQLVTTVEDTTQPPSVTNCPLIVSAIDHDDVGNLDYQSILNRAGSKEYMATKYFVRKFRPAALVQLYSGGVNPGYKPSYNTWVDCNNASMSHYGFKACLQPSAPAGIYGYNIRISLYVSFKGRIN